MIEIQGKYNKAIVYTDYLDTSAYKEILDLCNQGIYKDSTIRIMPDVHAGMGCVIGLTMTIHDKVCPNLVGVDIGCGMITCKLGKIDIDLEDLDRFIRENIPSGQEIHGVAQAGLVYEDWLNTLVCANNVDMNRALCSLGTLGGGNHFIEIDEDKEGNKYLIIHSGSRYLGKQVCNHYQRLAYNKLKNNRDAKEELIATLKAQGREKEIQQALKNMKMPKIRKDTAYLEGEDMSHYLHDLYMVQDYAEDNREKIAEAIIRYLGIAPGLWHISYYHTVHNYVDHNGVLRKGAVSAKSRELVTIPMNMRDGCIIGLGRGNEEWNYSAPHGAGRVMSRGQAKEIVNMTEFVESMQGIYTTSVCESTIDESPFAYKNVEDILIHVGETVDVQEVIKPIYNFKAK